MNQMICDFCEALRPCIELIPADDSSEHSVSICRECLGNASRAADEGCTQWEA